MRSIKLYHIRIISQVVFLFSFLFLFIQTESKGDDVLGYPVRVFLDFDPLLSVTTLLSSHVIASAAALSTVLLAATLVFGRVFCGWVCPLGTLHDMTGALNRPSRKNTGPAWRSLKYYILVFIVACSIFGLHLAGILDPLSLLVRSLSLAVYPLFNIVIRSLFDGLYHLDIPAVTAISEPIYTFLKNSVLSFNQPRFEQAFFVGLIFAAVLGLNFIQRRFWCRSLCPLGAFLGLVSRFSLLRRSVAEGCTECGACVRGCQGGADPERKEGWRKQECLYCGNCEPACPRHVVAFGFKAGACTAPLNLQRRNVIASALGAFVAVPLFRLLPASGSTKVKLIRPPGAIPEKDFLKRCLKCGECMKVCITNGLQPAFLQAGLEGIWTPILMPGIGYCEYRCTLCGQVCPTGAIRSLTIDEKAKFKIGLASIDQKKCLPYADGVPCIVCEEVCPVPQKAVLFDEARLKDRTGKEKRIKQPRIDPDRCTGCGICENKCPVENGPAITISGL